MSSEHRKDQKSTDKVRKKIIINKRFQFGMIFKVAWPLFLLTLAVFFIAYWSVENWQKHFHFATHQEFCQGICALIKNNMAHFITPEEKFWSLLFNLLVALGLAFVFFVILYLGIVFMYISHRIIGPASRFEQAFADILRGNLTNRIQLREKDEFQDLANHYNNMAETLQDRIKRVYQFNQHMQNAIQEMQNNPENDKESSLQKILELSQGIEEDLEKFTFRSD